MPTCSGGIINQFGLQVSQNSEKKLKTLIRYIPDCLGKMLWIFCGVYYDLCACNGKAFLKFLHWNSRSTQVRSLKHIWIVYSIIQQGNQ